MDMSQHVKDTTDKDITCEKNKDYLWTNHVDHLAQYILKKHWLLAHAFHSMQLLLIKKLHFIPSQNTVSIQIYAFEPAHKIN